MEFERCKTPPPSPEGEDHQAHSGPPSTPGPTRDGLPRTVIPPSPGSPHPYDFNTSPAESVKVKAPPHSSKGRRTAGVQKPSAKVAKAKVNFVTVVNAAADGKKTVGFLDLPGEIRNLIYSFTSQNLRQALLVHRPRIASLRSRTRLDRQRTLASDVIDQDHDKSLAVTGSRRGSRANKSGPKSSLIPRETNRPFFGLTQVCRLLRQEYRPIYMQRQEVGMDLVEAVPYLRTFYFEAPALLENLSTSDTRKLDLPFTGNLTIAVGDKIKEAEKAAKGVDVWPLLDVWANSFKIEAGFGRYMRESYDPAVDGEAKDLYRLFGRRVNPDRRCSPMNALWRTILRTRSLAAIRIHRTAIPTAVATHAHQPTALMRLASVPQAQRPFIHILFRPDAVEPWMTSSESKIPLGWLTARGFGEMEHFDIKVGVEPAVSK